MASNAEKAKASTKPKAKKRPAKKKTAAKKASAEETKASGSSASKSTSGAATIVSKASSVETVVASRTTRGVRERDVTAFLRQLIMLLEAGTPMLKSLKTLAQRGERQGIRNLISGISQQVESGSPLWQAFSREGRYFPPVFVNLIKAAEASGTVVPILRRMIAYREKRAMMTRRVQAAMIYPAIMVAFCFGVIVLLSKLVMPQFEDIFSSFEIELPPLTQMFFGLSAWVSSYWLIVVAVVAGVIALYKMWFVRNPVRRMMADRLKMKIPIFGGIMRRSAIVDFSRTFSILLRSGMSMMATLDLCRNSVGNRALVNSIQDMRDSVERGEGLEKPLRVAERQGVFPAVVVDMFVTGEETGTIDNVADQIADQYEEEVEIAVDALGEAIQPVATVFMGLIVAMIVFSLFQPLVSMIEQMSGGMGG